MNTSDYVTDRAATHSNRGLLYARVGDLQEAMRDHNRAVRMAPEVGSVYINRSNTLVRLQRFAPAMRQKGRLQEGADADIVVFDPDTILDQATYSLPARRSAGIEHVLVSGTFVVRDGEPVAGVFPGKAIRSEVSPSEKQVSGIAPAR